MRIVCTFCGKPMPLDHFRKYYFCLACGYFLSYNDVQLVINRERKMSSRKVPYRALYRHTYLKRGVLKQGRLVENQVCPICHEKTVYKLPDGRMICSKCLLSVYGNRVPEKTKDKIRQLIEQGYRPRQIVEALVVPYYTIWAVKQQLKEVRP